MLTSTLIPCLLATLLSPAAPADPPNLLIILADDVGVDNVGVYAEGPNPPDTPTIDLLARHGVLFRNAWSNPLCSPTRAGIHTGRYSFRTGVGTVIVDSGSNVLPLEEVTLPELFDLRPELGYRHALIGKWHLGATEEIGGAAAPQAAGWSHHAGTLTAIAAPQTYSNYLLTIDGVTQVSTEYATSESVDLALEWVAENRDQPWLMLLAFNAAHQPFHAPPKDLHDEDLPIGGPLAPRINPKPYYNAMVTAMDTEISNLLRGLGSELDNTTIFFLGDNGTPNQVAEDPFLPTHAKATPFEGGINVPLIVAGRGVTRPGREVEHLVHTTDLFSTCADLAGIDLAATLPDDRIIDSVSMTPYLARPNAAPRRSTVFSELFLEDEDAPAIQTMRDARFKLIRVDGSNGNFDLLFDLENDPFEENNLLRNGPAGLDALAAAHYAFLSLELESLLATGDDGSEMAGQ